MGPMEDTMTWLYDEMILMKQIMAPLIGIQKNSQEVVKLSKIKNKEVE